MDTIRFAILAMVGMTIACAAQTPEATQEYATALDPAGPDLTLCQIAHMGQYGRLGDVVGLAIQPTEWNIGNATRASPDPVHPFFVVDMYRLDDLGDYTRVVHIGQSWAHHLYCSLDSSQCDTACIGTRCGSLGIGCTSTSSEAMLASPYSKGPKSEINPWLRAWSFEGSHLAAC